MYEQIRFSHYLPYYSQIASLDLAREIFEERYDPVNDPGWRSFGAQTPEDYAYWVSRACGIVCVKMCAEGFGMGKRTVHEWIKRGLDHNGYLVLEENGKCEECGWIHGTLAELLCAEGLNSQAVPASLPEIIRYLRDGNLFIASVSYQLGTQNPITFKGGHMVVVHGADIKDGLITSVHIHNPSGRIPALQANAAIPAGRFISAYAGKGIVTGLP